MASVRTISFVKAAAALLAWRNPLRALGVFPVRIGVPLCIPRPTLAPRPELVWILGLGQHEAESSQLSAAQSSLALWPLPDQSSHCSSNRLSIHPCGRKASTPSKQWDSSPGKEEASNTFRCHRIVSQGCRQTGSIPKARTGLVIRVIERRPACIRDEQGLLSGITLDFWS